MTLPLGKNATDVTTSSCSELRPLKGASCSPVSRLRRMTLQSPLPTTTRVLSGEIAIDDTDGTLFHEPLVSARAESSTWPELLSQTLTERSNVPETMRLPFGVNATDVTTPDSPPSVRNNRPAPASQTLTDLSVLPETSIWPSGENATAFTAPACPTNVSRRWPKLAEGPGGPTTT